MWYPWPAWLRFRVSQSAFERVVASGGPDKQDQVVGLYLVRRVDRFDNGDVFFNRQTPDALPVRS